MFLLGVMKMNILARDKKGTLSSQFQRGGGYFLLRGEGSTNFDQEGDAPPLTPLSTCAQSVCLPTAKRIELELSSLNSDFQFFRNLHGSYKTVSSAPDVRFGQFLDLAWGS